MKLSCSLFLTLAQSFTLPALAAVEMVWERLPGHAKDIGVGADGSAWIIGSANRNGIAYRWGGTNWVATDGSGVFIAVGPAGDPWVVDIDSKLRHRMNDQWVLITEHGSATEVGIGADGTVLIAGGNSCYCGPVFNQKLYRYDPVLGFILLTGQGVVIQPDATGHWVINDQGELFHAQGEADYVKIPAHARDISVAAKAVKNFGAEFDKLKVKFGYLNSKRLTDADVLALADLPSLDVLRAKLLGLFNAPATKLVRLINTPASQLARVLQAKADKGG